MSSSTTPAQAPESARGGTSALFLVAVLLVAVVGAACTGGGGDDLGDRCQRTESLQAAIAEISTGEELPEPAALRRLVDDVVDLAAALDDEVRGDDETLGDAFREVEISGLEYRRSVEPYGYDLLAARTQGSTEEDERLYSFEHATTVAALDQIAVAADGWCAAG